MNYVNIRITTNLYKSHIFPKGFLSLTFYRGYMILLCYLHCVYIIYIIYRVFLISKLKDQNSAENTKKMAEYLKTIGPCGVDGVCFFQLWPGPVCS